MKGGLSEALLVWWISPGRGMLGAEGRRASERRLASNSAAASSFLVRSRALPLAVRGAGVGLRDSPPLTPSEGICQRLSTDLSLVRRSKSLRMLASRSRGWGLPDLGIGSLLSGDVSLRALVPRSGRRLELRCRDCRRSLSILTRRRLSSKWGSSRALLSCTEGDVGRAGSVKANASLSELRLRPGGSRLL